MRSILVRANVLARTRKSFQSTLLFLSVFVFAFVWLTKSQGDNSDNSRDDWSGEGSGVFHNRRARSASKLLPSDLTENSRNGKLSICILY